MAGALVSLVMEQLRSIMFGGLEQKVRLIGGVEEEVQKLKSNLSAVQAGLDDAETRQAKEATVRDWLEKLKDVAYDIEDVLDDWDAAILDSQGKPGDEQDPQRPQKKVRYSVHSVVSHVKQVGTRLDLAKKIKELNESLDFLDQQKERYQFALTKETQQIERSMTISMIDTTEVKGRDDVKSNLVNMLLSQPTVVYRPYLPVISIVGMGGIGKTTLAQFAFNHDNIKTYFDEKIWVCVSDPFNETRVAKAILESLLGYTPNLTELESLLQKIRQSAEKKNILLVMDDVWEEDSTKWNKLKQSLRSASPKSKVLVTTRNEKVAGVMGCNNDDILKVGILSDDECWSIVGKIAFSGRRDAQHNNLEAIGREISKKCKGLPLAAKALGGTLQFRHTIEQWQQILHSEMWEVEEAQKEVFPALWLSYFDLTPELKRCFSYCAIFPKDYEIRKSELIELWMAQGYLEGEIDGECYFQNLAMRFFFQDFVRDYLKDDIVECKMHDIVHDFAQIVARNECGVRHLFLDFGSYLNPSQSLKKCRSLFMWSNTTTEELSRLFSESTHVRSLSLRYCDFAEIPASIGTLVQLRWLDLSWNGKLKQLPETLCELHSLQTIDVSWCRQLEQWPLGIGKLINLRHLHNLCGPIRLPKGIGQLIGLRTLEEVDVGCGDDDAFSLGDLKNLNQLRGSLKISGLGAYKRQVGEARQAELKQKERIIELTLLFSVEPHTTGNEELLLLEALEPSPNLELLRLNCYRGTSFPSWMILSENLREIELDSCEHLPSLGKLPSLETLYISGMNGVKKVGKELLGIETQIGESKSEISASSASSSSSSPVVVAFPKLKKLRFMEMPDWEEWEDYYNDNYDGTTKPPPIIIIMPSLLSLHFITCPRLKTLPDYILQNTKLKITAARLNLSPPPFFTYYSSSKNL